jgi:2-keto-4-pentenoate hydratase
MAAGEIVITGSALRTRFPQAGDEISYRIAGLGETIVRIG